MATQVAAAQQGLSPSLTGQLLRDFVEAFDSIQKQLSDGSVQPIVPLTKIASLGSEGVGILKKHLENATCSAFSVSVNASANSVCMTPTGPMPPKQKVTKQTLANPGQATVSKGGSDKVPRPPNAFIIYRKDWHSTILAQNPGVHNNSISVIIGDKWKGESEEVREIYKRKAEDVKRQHELNHPDYQYQPRKPSEKKRRMTKTKLAKLAKAQAEANGYVSEQQSLPDDFDPATLLDQSLGAHTASHSMQLATFGPDHTLAQALIHDSVHAGLSQFQTGAGLEERLLASLQEFNEHAPAQNAPTAAAFAGNNNAGALWNFAGMAQPAFTTVQVNAQLNAQAARSEGGGAVVALPTVNGQLLKEVKGIPYLISPRTTAFIQQPWHHQPDPYRNDPDEFASVPRRAPGQQMIPPNIIEVLRQEALEEMFSKYTYVGAHVDSPSPCPSPVHVGPPGFDVDVTITSDAVPPTTTSVLDIAMPEIGDQGGAEPLSVSEPEPAQPGPAAPYVPQPNYASGPESTYASGPQFTDTSEPPFQDLASLFGLDDFDLIFDDGMTEDFMTDA
ncbi:hypothetical protein LTR91_003986 [Friedmanniomyces endolithicus]|uniref:HMG box domain-containing protein n=1 Tax=Friedmanniomyces endolithicus TaxID=329885 RepID=A0A4U0TVF2_9PEZI|nr:hypothetical protein LTS09_008320 [Friedmanniomyces endolithicus]KAK0276577.1 hypothetical protein LTR35_010441 [Friedmanniomyces endolithicus]KAK0294185.1 hypothetical protein LTS00_007159 [Friedmanniomyces endolithicus]KAK0303361.1 hypothetical protein LTR01_008089 [Friedmanniomyces endolithicus]KAK0315137.1 hypothetical protein LTR82_012695 [Friedmanniomyces endolithicus]